jgi:hypothetical protein
MGPASNTVEAIDFAAHTILANDIPNRDSFQLSEGGLILSGSSKNFNFVIA